MAESVEHRTCKRGARDLIRGETECVWEQRHRRDACNLPWFVYAEVDCKRLRGQMLCWISLYSVFDDALLASFPCPSTPRSALFPRELFVSERERNGYRQ